MGDPRAGERVFVSAGCGRCHTFKAAGTHGKVGPNLDVHLRMHQGNDKAHHIRESIVNPNAEIAKGFKPGVMPQDFAERLTQRQLDDLVAFLLANS